ncbi:MAG: hypothetical protein SFV22_16165 [Saprospiraceae bacterium]|nr:hypothetical protein [Saprospiraceae bacterium]
MAQLPVNETMLEGMTPSQLQYIGELRQAAEIAETRGQRYEEAWSTLFDQNKSLREENHRLQHDYETLRIQKGGFGFKMLLLSGLGGFVTALLLCFVYLKLKPKDPHTTALHHFRRTHLFEYELALSNRKFDEVKISLEKNIQHPDYQAIKPDLEIMRELVEAAEKGAK